MAFNLVSEYQGFIKFIVRANHELVKWFGPYCKDDPVRIAFMAAREWDGMAELERKPFIRSNQEEPIKVSSYFKYLLQAKYSGSHTFDPKDAKQYGEKWMSLAPEDKRKFSSIQYASSAIDHVLEKRAELHRAYEPQKLCLLEFIIKTKPKWPTSARIWFSRSESLGLGSAETQQRWVDLDPHERGIFERCAVLDRKRYDFEKNAWITKLLTLDLDGDFNLGDFQTPEIKTRIESLGSFIDLSRDLPAMISLKRPRNPFSLFIEAYRYQIRDQRPEFQFGRHLRECSEAWAKLSEDEREGFKRESKLLREKRRNLLADEPQADSRLTIPVDLFKNTKLVYGPCRPSHLYSRSVPSAMSIWAKENNIARRDQKAKWAEASPELRQFYEQAHWELSESRAKAKADVEGKLKHIKRLLRESCKLQDLKQELRLIGSSNKVVKNLYT